MTDRRPDWPFASGVVAFALSGFAALVYQVAWQRILALFSGVHTWSVTVIVTAFMVGLGLGSLLGGRVADRLAPLAAARAFAACEVAVAFFGAASPWLYYDLAYTHLGALVRHAAVLPLVHFALLVAPTLLMGASLPLLSRALVVTAGPTASMRIAWLYAANTLGAAAGAWATSWWLAGAIGFAGATRVAAWLNVGAAVLALGVMRGRHDAAPESVEVATRSLEGPAVRRWAATYGLSGFIALGLEMIWLRALGTMIKASPYTFGHVLGILLLALGLGGLLGARAVWRRTTADAGSVFLRLQWGAVVSASLPFLALPFLVRDGAPLDFFYRFLASDSPLEMERIAQAANTGSGGDLLTLAASLWILVPVAVIVPGALFMGASYAWIQRAVQTDVREIGRRVGLVQAANVFGCALGSAATGLLFFDRLGTAGTLRLLVALGGVFGLLLASRHRGARQRGTALVAAFLPLALAVALPGKQRFWSALHGAEPAAIIVAEDASSVVSLHAHPEAVMRVNGIGHSLVPYGEIWALLGILPVLVHGDAKTVLIIGMATGGTPWSAAKMPGVERVDLYEIARPERQALLAWEMSVPTNPEVREFLTHPRIRTSFTDGRLALRLEPTRYDVIEADATEPYMAYSGNLYSLEFFREARRRLAEGGLVCTYVPSRRVGATVRAAFPHVLSLRAGDTNIMMGAERRIPFDIEHVLVRMDAPEVRASFASTARGTWLLEQVRTLVTSLKVTVIGPDTPRPHHELNTDLFPRDEFDWRLGPPDSSLEP